MGVISDPLYPDGPRPLSFFQRGRVRYERPGAEGYEQREYSRKLDAVMTLSGFFRYMWPVVHPGDPLLWGPHIDVVCWGLEQLAFGNIEGNVLVINIPPRHLKSEIVSRCFPAWLWLHSPWLKIMSLSTSDRVATNDTKGMRALVQSDRFKELVEFAAKLFGDNSHGIWKLTHDQNQKTRFENTLSGKRIGLAAGADVIGEGADVQIVDDPIDSKDATEGAPDAISARMIETINRWGGVWDSRLNNPETSIRVVIMQRLHEMDLAGWLLARGTPSIVLPTEFNPNHPYLSELDWRTTPGELLFEERLGPRKVAEMKGDDKKDGTWTKDHYAAQHGQLPVAQGGNMFPKEKWRHYTESPQDLLVRAWKRGRVITSWDCANKVTARAKFTSVHTMVRFLLAPDIYITHENREKLESPGQLALFDKLARERKPHVQVVELAGNGITLCQSRKGQKICEFNPGEFGGKEQRATFTQNRLSQGTIWLPSAATSPWAEDFKTEHEFFPRGQYCDRVDSTSQGVVYLDAVDPVTSVARETSETPFPFLRAEDGLGLMRRLSRVGRGR